MNKAIPLSVILGSLIIAAAILLSNRATPATPAAALVASAPPSLDSLRAQFTEQFTARYGYDGWETPEGKAKEIHDFEFLSAKYSSDLKAVELRFRYGIYSGKTWESTATLGSDAFYNYSGKVAGRMIALH